MMHSKTRIALAGTAVLAAVMIAIVWRQEPENPQNPPNNEKPMKTRRVHQRGPLLDRIAKTLRLRRMHRKDLPQEQWRKLTEEELSELLRYRTYPIIGLHGVSNRAKIELGISDQQDEEIESVIKEALEDVRQSFLSRIETLPTDDADHYRFKIPADPEEAERVRTSVLSRFEDVVGREDLAHVFTGVINGSDQFMGYGKNDVFIDITRRNKGDDNYRSDSEWSVYEERRKPGSGELVACGKVPLDVFNRSMKLFEIPDAPASSSPQNQ